MCPFFDSARLCSFLEYFNSDACERAAAFRLRFSRETRREIWGGAEGERGRRSITRDGWVDRAGGKEARRKLCVVSVPPTE